MSQTQILSNNATSLAVSVVPENEFDYVACFDRVTRAQKLKGATIERLNLRSEKVRKAMIDDYRSIYSQTYGKKQDIPKVSYDKIYSYAEEKCAELIKSNFRVDNIVQITTTEKFNRKTMKVVEVVTAKAENIMLLKRQHASIGRFKGDVERKMKSWEKEGLLTDDREKSLKEQIEMYDIALLVNEREQKKQEELQKIVQKELAPNS